MYLSSGLQQQQKIHFLTECVSLNLEEMVLFDCVSTSYQWATVIRQCPLPTFQTGLVPVCWYSLASLAQLHCACALQGLATICTTAEQARTAGRFASASEALGRPIRTHTPVPDTRLLFLSLQPSVAASHRSIYIFRAITRSAPWRKTSKQIRNIC